MTKNEKKQVTLQMSWLLFQFIHKHELDPEYFSKWTRRDFKKEIKEVVEEVSEEYGIQPAKPVIGCTPSKDEMWLSLYAVEGDPKTDKSLDRHLKWDEFEEALMDQELDQAIWFEAKFRSLADKLKRYIEE